jgi:hypothetical protein
VCISSAQELQLKGVSQWGQEPLVAEAEDATALEAVTKLRSEDRDWEHQPICDSDLYSVVASCVFNKSDYQSKPRLSSLDRMTMH